MKTWLGILAALALALIGAAVTLAAILVVLGGSVVAAPLFGTQCTPSAPQCATAAAAVQAAQRLHADLYLVRAGVPHPFTNTTAGARFGLQSVLSSDFDPVWAANNPDATDCIVGGVTYPYAYTLANANAAFHAGDTLTADVFAGTETVGCKINGVIYLRDLASQYVNAGSNYGVFGPGGLYPALAAAGIPIELVVFNNVRGTASDTGEISQASYRADLAYMFDVQIGGAGLPLPKWTRQGNEEDGGAGESCLGVKDVPQSSCAVSVSWNGETGYTGGTDVNYYLPKLHDLIFVAHARGVPVGDSGITVSGTQTAYWYSEYYTCGTPACRLAADLFQQGGYSKSLGQDRLSAGLPNSCSYFYPPFHAGALNHLARTMAILADDQINGVDFTVGHWYDVQWQYMAEAYAWVRAYTAKPLLIDEMATYSGSAFDTVGLWNGCQVIGAMACVWWDQESSGGNALAHSLVNADGSLRPAALALLARRGVTGAAYAGGPTVPTFPNLLTGPAPTQPFRC